MNNANDSLGLTEAQMHSLGVILRNTAFLEIGNLAQAIGEYGMRKYFAKFMRAKVVEVMKSRGNAEERSYAAEVHATWQYPTGLLKMRKDTLSMKLLMNLDSVFHVTSITVGDVEFKGKTYRRLAQHIS